MMYFPRTFAAVKFSDVRTGISTLPLSTTKVLLILFTSSFVRVTCSEISVESISSTFSVTVTVSVVCCASAFIPSVEIHNRAARSNANNFFVVLIFSLISAE